MFIVREIRLPCDLKFGRKPDKNVIGGVYVDELRKRMNAILKEIHSNIQVDSNKIKDHYDVGVQGTNFQPNDRV